MQQSATEHRWTFLPGSADGYECILCGRVVSATELASSSVPLPPCGEVDLDEEFAELLGGDDE